MLETKEEILDRDAKIKIRLIDTHDGVKFAIVYLLFLDNWVDIARIDNYSHEGKEGTHIHRFCEERVEFREMGFDEARETLIRIGDGIKERIKNASNRNC